ncbi:MAG: dihydrofolate reductase [Planctomycetaceae bacterium]
MGPNLLITAVVACTPGGVIGRDGGMPWRLKSDLQRFKKMTMGGTLVMGRKTFDTIGRPLPGRETIVLTRAAALGSAAAEAIPHLHWADRPDRAIELARQLAKPVFVVGGAEIYRIFWPQCDEIWLTRVLSDVSGDTHIELPLDEFELVESTNHRQTAEDSAATEFQRWRRKKSVPKI